ncbi:XerD Site-specific recombinase XerD [uncultured Caudovirales phage]|uniref:Integrase n=1 Tax=uncultured Caudovirales phage TaxID=2100421 RepID=A0A6J5SVQ2_9CAUD|nr:XerD Site-specific recombinase XerD [uncultured Caudovirales phage]
MQISNLIKTFEFELQRKNYRKQSTDNYVSCVTKFLYHFKDKDSVKHINEDDIKQFLYTFKESNTQRGYHSAIKAFYKYVCNQPNKFKWIEYAKRNRKLPIVLSEYEVQLIFNQCENLKHKAILSLLYSCGLRVGEVVALKIADVDSSRMIINILNAKGGKDRIVPMHNELLNVLRNYFKEFRPVEYLFNGQKKEQYTIKSIQELVKTYGEKAGIKKRIYPHLFRHSSFTNMLEGGVELSIIQKCAGHSTIKTTQLYTHISSTLLNRVYNPLQNISL